MEGVVLPSLYMVVFDAWKVFLLLSVAIYVIWFSIQIPIFKFPGIMLWIWTSCMNIINVGSCCPFSSCHVRFLWKSCSFFLQSLQKEFRLAVQILAECLTSWVIIIMGFIQFLKDPFSSLEDICIWLCVLTLTCANCFKIKQGAGERIFESWQGQSPVKD